ncbi:hypothetical protein E4T56_gene11910 [Termitomyces sp. T112]|nr:hypothetical protein E4T56_gene11910 [Termitomyces sp. T112]
MIKKTQGEVTEFLSSLEGWNSRVAAQGSPRETSDNPVTSSWSSQQYQSTTHRERCTITPPNLELAGLTLVDLVINAVALKYNLFVLALEDVLHEQGHDLSKADYYGEHVFIRTVCHALDRDNNEEGDLYREISQVDNRISRFSV